MAKSGLDIPAEHFIVITIQRPDTMIPHLILYKHHPS